MVAMPAANGMEPWENETTLKPGKTSALEPFRPSLIGQSKFMSLNPDSLTNFSLSFNPV